MPKSKWFAVAKEGATTDGRKISKVWLNQMAKNYSPKKYGARINLEHYKGVVPDGPFRAYGDVLALKTEERDGELYLLAELDATDDLVELNKKRQKVYTSMEVDPDFAGSGEAYLVGLAVTDQPASLGTEMLQFSANASANPLANRKQRPENLFTAAHLAELEFVADQPADQGPSLLEKVKGLFSSHKTDLDRHLAGFRADLEQTMELFATKIKDLESKTQGTQLPAEPDQAYTQLQADHQKLQQDFNELKTQLENEPSNTQFRRQPATGSAPELTDC